MNQTRIALKYLQKEHNFRHADSEQKGEEDSLSKHSIVWKRVPNSNCGIHNGYTMIDLLVGSYIHIISIRGKRYLTF